MASISMADKPPDSVPPSGDKEELAMTHPSVTVICQEHRAMSAMLRSITLLLREHRRRNTLPDFDALQAMLFYVDEFPEKLHHPKESRLLFPKLRGHDAHTDAVLDRLERDHERGEQAIRELEHALLGFRMMSKTGQCEARRRHFEALMKQYADFYIDHMHVEETEILPLAQTALSAEAWAELDAAFLTNRDPLAGHEAEEVYRPLFRKIVGALQHSGSVGSALEALAGAAVPKFSRPG
jgi:hemerythrin-like domain-containing protein